MNWIATKYAEGVRAVVAGCDRLVHPAVAAAEERAEQRRVLGALTAAPLLLSAAAWTILPSALGVAGTFGFISISFCAFGLSALAVTARRKAGLVLSATFALATVQIACLIAAAGGLHSPMSLIAVALPVEASMAMRTKRALGWGVAAMALALGLQLLATEGPFEGRQAAIWHWLIPLAYAGIILARTGVLPAAGATQARPLPNAEAGRLALRLCANGDLLDLDVTAREMLGIDPDLLTGTGFFERVHVADRVSLLCALADLRDYAGHRKVELRLRLPVPDRAAAYRPFAIDLSRDEEDDAVLVGFLRDNCEVAELRAALAASKELNDGIEVAKSRFLAAVSHELRTPLNSIIGFSDMLLCEVHGRLPDPRQREHLEIVRDAGNHLLDLVNSILDVSKIEAGAYPTNPEPFRFSEAAAFCTSMVRLQAGSKEVELATDVAPAIGEIRADRRAVQQILINLLSNAVKFTPKGGRVALRAKRVGTRLHFSVSDTGIGIAEGDLARLGQPFAQVRNDHTRQLEGTGLGLALVKGLVALHDGTMSIDSTFGQGTTVAISLPIEGPPAAVSGDVARLRGKPSEENANGALRKAS